MIKDDEWLKLVVAKNKTRRQSAIRYLKQLADGANGEKFAFVDIDGTRFTTNCMSALMREVYDGKLTVFYLTSTPAIVEPIDIEYHHFYYVAYYDKPSIKSLIRCLKNNHYIVWDCFEDFDIENNKGSRCEVDNGCLDGFLNFKRRKEAKRILNAKVRYWENNIIKKQ